MATHRFEAASSMFHRGWQRHIAESLMTGVASEKLVAEMVRSGFDREFAKRQVAECESTAGIEAGRALFRRQSKHRALFEAMAETARQSHSSSDFIKKRLTAEDFYQQYFWRNTPWCSKT